MGEDREVPGAKIYGVKAIHVTTTGNKRKFTMDELKLAGRSLAFRPLDINHEENRLLKFPDSMTMNMDFDSTEMAVMGRMRVADETTIAAIESGKIKKVSIEQIPTKGETCDEVSCEQHGVAFIGLGLLEDGVLPGDDRAEIIKLESILAPKTFQSLVNTELLSDMIVPDGQRSCKDCTDFQSCHKCKSSKETWYKEQDDCMEKAIREITAENPGMARDQVIAIALSKCGLSKPELAMEFFYRFKNK